MPEVTENYVRIPVKDSGNFTGIKTITISAGKHIKALVGKPKSNPGGSMQVITYLFDRSYWSMAEAKKWVSEHRVRESKEGLLEAVWTADYVKDLPDSSFVWVEPGGRHLPIKDASGKLDPVSVQDALSQLTEMTTKPPLAAVARLTAAAKQLKIGEYAEMKEYAIQESVTNVLEAAKIDRVNGHIYGVKLLGMESLSKSGKVNYRYTDKALKDFGGLLEGSNWYINHPPRDDPDRTRDVRDVGGKIRGTFLRPDGLYGDLQVAGNNSWLYDLVETCPDAIGMSLNGRGVRRYSKPVNEIVEGVSANSADMVTDPATTRTLFESQQKTEEVTEVKFEEITLEQLREQRGDLVAKIEEEVKQGMDTDTKITELRESLTAKDTELKETKQELDKLVAEKALIAKREKAIALVEAAKLPKEVVTDVFMESLANAADEDGMKAIVEDRKALVESVQNRPTSEARTMLETDDAKKLAKQGVAAVTS